MMRPSRLVRVATVPGREPYFGSTGRNRFDAPGCPGLPEYSTCYFGTSLAVAIAETVLHDEIPVDGEFHISTQTLNDKHVLHFRGRQLRLADMTGAQLKRLGGTAELAGTADYAVTQAWALAVYTNPGNFDGFIYMSRHFNTNQAVVLFNRAVKKITLKSSEKLTGANGFAQAAALFRISAS